MHIDEAAQLGFDDAIAGRPMPEAVMEDDLLECAWRAGRTQAIDKGLANPREIQTASIAIKNVPGPTMHPCRIPDAY